MPSDHRKYRIQTKCTEDNRYRGKHSGQNQQPRILTNTNNGPVQAERTDRTTDQTRTTADTTKKQWTEHRHRKQTSPIGQPSPDRGGGVKKK